MALFWCAGAIVEFFSPKGDFAVRKWMERYHSQQRQYGWASVWYSLSSHWHGKPYYRRMSPPTVSATYEVCVQRGSFAWRLLVHSQEIGLVGSSRDQGWFNRQESTNWKHDRITSQAGHQARGHLAYSQPPGSGTLTFYHSITNWLIVISFFKPNDPTWCSRNQFIYNVATFIVFI